MRPRYPRHFGHLILRLGVLVPLLLATVSWSSQAQSSLPPTAETVEDRFGQWPGCLADSYRFIWAGDYEDPVAHADGRYELQLAGARVAATFSTSRVPVSYWAREVAATLFTVPEPFRPPYSVLRTAVGTPVLADGTVDLDHPGPRRFLLRVEPDGTVHYVSPVTTRAPQLQVDRDGSGWGALHYVDAAPVEEEAEYLAYTLHTVWGTTPAANDRAVLEILDAHWFGESLLSAEPPPVQFEVPAHVGGYDLYEKTIPAALVGAFVTFDADGRVTALGAPTNEAKVSAGAPDHRFHGSLPAELGQLHRLEHLDLEYHEFVSSMHWGPVRGFTQTAWPGTGSSRPDRPR